MRLLTRSDECQVHSVHYDIPGSKWWAVCSRSTTPIHEVPDDPGASYDNHRSIGNFQLLHIRNVLGTKDKIRLTENILPYFLAHEVNLNRRGTPVMKQGWAV